MFARVHYLLAVVVVVLLGGSGDVVSGQAAPRPAATILLRTTTTVTGQPLIFPLFRNQVTALVAEIAPGGQTGRLQHPFPSVVYVLEGSVTDEVEGQPSRLFGGGQAFAEAVNVPHNAFNRTSAPAKFLLVAFGEQGKPLIVRSSDSTPVGFRTTTLLQATKTWSGEPILFPALANQFVVLSAEFVPGAMNPHHIHSHTQFTWNLQGALFNQADGLPPKTQEPGEAVVETIRAHETTNRGTTITRQFVIFVGEAGTPPTVYLPRP